MKTETINGAIEELDAHIRNDEQQLLERKHAVNTLCGLVGQLPRFNTHTGLRTVAPQIPTLADHEEANGDLPGEREVKPQRRVGAEKVKPAKVAAGHGRQPSVERLEVEAAAARLGTFTLDTLMVECPRLAKTQGRKWFSNVVTYGLSRNAFKQVARGEWAIATVKVKPALPHPSPLPGERVPKAAAAKIPSSPSRPSRDTASLPALTEPLTRRDGEDDDVLVRRVIAHLPEPFTRNDLDEFLPPDFVGAQLGLTLKVLRSAEEIVFAEQAVGNGPQKYLRGPNWKAGVL